MINKNCHLENTINKSIIVSVLVACGLLYLAFTIASETVYAYDPPPCDYSGSEDPDDPSGNGNGSTPCGGGGGPGYFEVEDDARLTLSYPETVNSGELFEITLSYDYPFIRFQSWSNELSFLFPFPYYEQSNGSFTIAPVFQLDFYDNNIGDQPSNVDSVKLGEQIDVVETFTHYYPPGFETPNLLYCSDILGADSNNTVDSDYATGNRYNFATGRMERVFTVLAPLNNSSNDPDNDQRSETYGFRANLEFLNLLQENRKLNNLYGYNYGFGTSYAGCDTNVYRASIRTEPRTFLPYNGSYGRYVEPDSAVGSFRVRYDSDPDFTLDLKVNGSDGTIENPVSVQEGDAIEISWTIDNDFGIRRDGCYLSIYRNNDENDDNYGDPVYEVYDPDSAPIDDPIIVTADLQMSSSFSIDCANDDFEVTDVAQVNVLPLPEAELVLSIEPETEDAGNPVASKLVPRIARSLWNKVSFVVKLVFPSLSNSRVLAQSGYIEDPLLVHNAPLGSKFKLAWNVNNADITSCTGSWSDGMVSETDSDGSGETSFTLTALESKNYSMWCRDLRGEWARETVRIDIDDQITVTSGAAAETVDVALEFGIVAPGANPTVSKTFITTHQRCTVGTCSPTSSKWGTIATFPEVQVPLNSDDLIAGPTFSARPGDRIRAEISNVNIEDLEFTGYRVNDRTELDPERGIYNIPGNGEQEDAVATTIIDFIVPQAIAQTPITIPIIANYAGICDINSFSVVPNPVPRNYMNTNISWSVTPGCTSIQTEGPGLPSQTTEEKNGSRTFTSPNLTGLYEYYIRANGPNGLVSRIFELQVQSDPAVSFNGLSITPDEGLLPGVTGEVQRITNTNNTFIISANAGNAFEGDISLSVTSDLVTNDYSYRLTPSQINCEAAACGTAELEVDIDRRVRLGNHTFTVTGTVIGDSGADQQSAVLNVNVKNNSDGSVIEI